MNLGSRCENVEIPDNLHALFGRKRISDSRLELGALDSLLFTSRGVHPVLRRDCLERGPLSYKKGYDEVITPVLLRNVSFNTRNDDSMITSVSTYKGILAASNTRGTIGIYNIDEMLRFRDLNNGKGPGIKFPLGYVLTEREERRQKRGRSFKLEPIHYISPGENENHRGVVSAVNLSPYDGQLFTTTGWDGNLKVWDAQEGACALSLGSRSKVNHSVICETNPNIVSLALQSGNVGIVDLRIGEFSQTLFLDKKTTNLKLDRADSPILSIAWRTNSEQILASTSQNGFIRLWDLRFAPQPFLYMNSNLTDWEFVQETSSMNPFLIRQQMIQEGVGDHGDGRGPGEVGLQGSPEKVARQYMEGRLNEDERRFLKVEEEVTKDHSTSMHSSRDLLGKYQSHFGISAPSTIGYAHESGVGFCKFLKNGRFLVSSAQDGTIKLWNALTGRSCHISYDRFESQALWEGDGLVEPGIDDQIQKYFKRFSLDSEDQDTLFHPNGNDVGIWNIRTGKCLKRLSAHINAKSVSVIHLNSYNNLLFSGDQNGYIHVWNTCY
ncbi:WD repeat protein [Cryptosporidium canis]|uniref:WD repeat protein n=1 Tax=Cryptosporidium canis TaxID=195482 RepID=A0A9D5DIN1_9CRYT|nr:WD repeat protein [Cryptosporidium canis]